MTTTGLERLTQLAKQLNDVVVTAAYCATEIHAALQAEEPNSIAVLPPTARPLLNSQTFCVTWQGKSLYLGNTRSFWMLGRLARRPNQYVTHLDLLNDVWDNETLTTATIRSTVCQLRRRLRDNQMHELADAIKGHNGHYGLML